MDKKIKNLLHEASAPVLLMVPFFLLMLFLFLFLSIVPYELLYKTAFILLLAGISIFSRAIEAWQFGVEVHHFILFGVVYVFGIWWALLFVTVTSLVNILMVLFVRSHMFIHTMLGPMLQTLEMLLVAILLAIYAGLSGGGFAQADVLPITSIIIIGTAVEKLLCHKFAGVDLGRLSTATVVAAIVNYNLMLYIGARYLAFLSSL